MWYIYTLEYYSAIKENEIMPFAATWMALEIIILSEVSQKKKDKYHMISLICEIFKNDTNGEFPGGPVVRTLRFHCGGPGFDPWSKN